jgi:hypothetical protein
MGVIKDLQLEPLWSVFKSFGCTNLLGAMREVEYLQPAPDWKRANIALELEEARKKAKEVRQIVTALKRKYGIKKRRYRISISDPPSEVLKTERKSPVLMAFV